MSSEFLAGEMVSAPAGCASPPVQSSNVDGLTAETLGDAADGRTFEVQSSAATLFVYRDEDDVLHWKAALKGARWHNSKSQSIGEVCRQADEVMPTERYEIDYVESRS